MHPGKLIPSNLVEMCSVKQLHPKAPMMQLQAEEICHFPSYHQHCPHCLVTTVHGLFPIQHNAQRVVPHIPEVRQTNTSPPPLLGWKTATRNLTPISIHSERLAAGLGKGEKYLVLSLRHNKERTLGWIQEGF